MAGQQLDQASAWAPSESMKLDNTSDTNGRSSLAQEALDSYQPKARATQETPAVIDAGLPIIENAKPNEAAGGEAAKLTATETTKPAEAATETTKATDTVTETAQPTDAAEQSTKLKTIFLTKESYPGEFGIKIDAKPQKLISKGETVDELARKHLGPDASEQDIAKHAKEIRAVNYMGKETTTTEKGATLTLPGHTKDGAIAYSDYRGSRFTVTENNQMTVQNSDGTKYTLTGNPEGGYTKVYSGSKPEDNYTVKVNAEGIVESNDRVDPNHKEAGSLDSERTRLNDAASNTILLGKENTQFHKDMQKFEERARTSGMSDQEVAKTYNEVSRILETEGNKPLTDRERVRMALGIMSGAAEPTAKSQGEYETCQVTVIQNKLYMTEPSTVARTLADVATTGKFVAVDGTPVVLRPDDLRAHGQAGENAERGTRSRDYAGQVYQVTAINSFYARHNELDVPVGEMRFEQGKQIENKNNGERLVDYSTIPPKVYHNPGRMAYPNGLAETEYLMSGKYEPKSILSSGEYFMSTRDDSDQTSGVTGAKHLERRLQQLQADGQYPLHVVVHVNSDAIFPTRVPEKVPFANKPNSNNYLADVHVVNVIGYDKETGTVKVDNQWAKGSDLIDKPLTVDQLWEAMNRPKANIWLDRLEAKRSEMKPEEFSGHLNAIMKAYTEEWQDNENYDIPLDQKDITTSRERANKLADSLDPKLGQPVKADIDRMFKDWEEKNAKAKAEEAKEAA
jgi:hypothetical protein